MTSPRKSSVFSALSLLLVFPALTVGDDWPQWQGPQRTGHSAETDLLASWPEGGPQRLWLYEDCGVGYSSPSIVGNRLFIMGSRQGMTHLMAIDVQSGSPLWTTPIVPEFEEHHGNGPRGAPTVAGDYVYGLTGAGTLICARIADGSEVWRRTMQDFGGSIPGWGFCESPVVEGNTVICTPGGPQGSVVALEHDTGDLRWQSTEVTDGAHYASMLPVDHFGQRQLIQLLPSQVVGLSVHDGQVLWRIARDGPTAVVTTPIYRDGYVYVSSGYGAGCLMFHVSRNNRVEEIYRNKVIKNHHGGVLLIGDVLLGCDGNNSSRGFVCQDFVKGRRVWQERSELGGGAIIYADQRLYTLSEKDGMVRLVDVSEEGWTLEGEFLLNPQSKNRRSGKAWTHPVIANGRLYLRDQEYLFCYDVREK